MQLSQKEILERLRIWLQGRQTDYRTTFQGAHAERVLIDLARFCRAHESTANPNPQVAARLDGRREVWLRICHHLKLDPDTLWSLYSKRNQNV